MCCPPWAGLATVLLRGSPIKRPADDATQRPATAAEIFLASGAELHSVEQLRYHRHTGADANATLPNFARFFGDPAAAVDKVAHDSGIQEAASHSHILRSVSARSLNVAFSNSFCSRRACSQAARSSCVKISGSSES